VRFHHPASPEEARREYEHILDSIR
jgi:hypothetical protein